MILNLDVNVLNALEYKNWVSMRIKIQNIPYYLPSVLSLCSIERFKNRFTLSIWAEGNANIFVTHYTNSWS